MKEWSYILCSAWEDSLQPVISTSLFPPTHLHVLVQCVLSKLLHLRNFISQIDTSDRTIIKKCCGHKICVSFFSAIFMHNIFHSNKYLASYTGDACKSCTKVLQNCVTNFSESSLILNLIKNSFSSSSIVMLSWHTDRPIHTAVLRHFAAIWLRLDNTNICSYLQRHNRGCICCSRHVEWRRHCWMCFSLWCSINARSQNLPFFDQFTIRLLQLH